MLVLGIETSCDETAAAVIEDGRKVRSDVVASQVLVHAAYGGVVPEVASRQHLATVVPVLRSAVEQAGIALADLDGIAVTCGPGLVGALLVGVEAAKALALDPTIPDAWAFVGTAEQVAGHAKEARVAYQRFLELAPPGRRADDIRAILKTLPPGP